MTPILNMVPLQMKNAPPQNEHQIFPLPKWQTGYVRKSVLCNERTHDAFSTNQMTRNYVCGIQLEI